MSTSGAWITWLSRVTCSTTATHFLHLIGRSQWLEREHYNVNDPHVCRIIVPNVSDEVLSRDVNSIMELQVENAATLIKV